MTRIEFLEMGLIGKRKVLLGRRCIYIIYADRWVWEGERQYCWINDVFGG